MEAKAEEGDKKIISYLSVTEDYFGRIHETWMTAHFIYTLRGGWILLTTMDRYLYCPCCLITVDSLDYYYDDLKKLEKNHNCRERRPDSYFCIPEFRPDKFMNEKDSYSLP